MNVINLIPFIYDRLLLFLFVFTRIAALFSTFVVFRHGTVNRRIMIGLSSLLSLYVVLFYQDKWTARELFSLQTVIQELLQFFIGFMSALVLNIVFEVFVTLGQIISTQIGLSLASMFDPAMGSITNLTQFYTFSITLTFFLLDGHLVLIKTIIESFGVLPVGHALSLAHPVNTILRYSSIIFSGALVLAITVVIAILVTNVAMAVMSRFAPQFNLFSIGVNLMLVLGLICVYVTFGLFVSKGSILLQESLTLIHSVILGLK